MAMVCRCEAAVAGRGRVNSMAALPPKRGEIKRQMFRRIALNLMAFVNSDLNAKIRYFYAFSTGPES